MKGGEKNELQKMNFFVLIEAFRLLIFGTITVLVIILMPEGITEAWDYLKSSLSGRLAFKKDITLSVKE